MIAKFVSITAVVWIQAGPGQLCGVSCTHHWLSRSLDSLFLQTGKFPEILKQMWLSDDFKHIWICQLQLRQSLWVLVKSVSIPRILASKKWVPLYTPSKLWTSCKGSCPVCSEVSTSVNMKYKYWNSVWTADSGMAISLASCSLELFPWSALLIDTLMWVSTEQSSGMWHPLASFYKWFWR